MGSILDDIDVQLESGDEALKYIIMQFIQDNYDFYTVDEMYLIHMILKNPVSISDNPNKDGKYEVLSVYNVSVVNLEIEHLTNGLFVWKSTKCFDCSNCKSLKSLEGAPKEIKFDFDCSRCNSLKSLKGAPKEVGGNFSCSFCYSLESLKGCPEKVGGNFSCSHCHSLTSLKGVPEKVEGYFNCSYCQNLKSLEGSPRKVNAEFCCYRCEDNFTRDDVKAVCNIAKEKIYC